MYLDDTLLFIRSQFHPYDIIFYKKDLISFTHTSEYSNIDYYQYKKYWYCIGAYLYIDFTKVKYILDNNPNQIIYRKHEDGGYCYLEFRNGSVYSSQMNFSFCSSRISEVTMDSEGNIINN